MRLTNPFQPMGLFPMGCVILALAFAIGPVQAQGSRLTVPISPPTGGGGGGGDAAIESIYVGEEISLQANNGEVIERVIVSRPELLVVETFEMNARIVKVRGLAVGRTNVTIWAAGGEVSQRTDIQLLVLLRPSEQLEIINSKLKEFFPLADVKVMGDAGGFIITGTVDSTEEVDPILRFVQAYGQGAVTNSIRVSGVMQVQLEVCIAQVSRTEMRGMGFNFFNSNDDNSFLGSTVGNVVPNPFTGVRAQIQGSEEIPILTSGGSFAARGDGNFVFSLFDDNSSFTGFLSALRTEGVAKILANPTVMAFNGKQGNVRSGGVLLIRTQSAVGSGGLERVPFGTEVTFVPTILADGRIRLSVQPRVRTPDQSLSSGPGEPPGLREQTVETTVELNSGQSLAIGGLLQTDVSASTAKVPVLGDLPFIGTMFRSVQATEVEQELIIIVTPRLVDALDCNQRHTKLPGQETRPPTDFELFIEGILEAPRGPREVFPNGQYKASHLPCPEGVTGCAGGNCGHHHGAHHLPPVQRIPVEEHHPLPEPRPEVMQPADEAVWAPIEMSQEQVITPLSIPME